MLFIAGGLQLTMLVAALLLAMILVRVVCRCWIYRTSGCADGKYVHQYYRV